VPVVLAVAFHVVIFPMPVAASPMTVLELVHANVEPVGVLEKAGIVIAVPGQTATLVIELVLGVGLMVTVKLIVVPVQPLRIGITVIVPVIFAFVLLIGAFHEEMFPVPLEANPMAVLELAHAKVPPVGILTKAGILIVLPGQVVIFVI
jgi:hypothetical protein